ncbi:MAG: hypothetical protein PHS57_06175 [Alphaproteobacteria bacterium]|nr:hypothetical protein [Alphaproteobacteria bacterium]
MTRGFEQSPEEEAPSERVVVYCGFLRETEVETFAEVIGGIAGRIACLECGGSGVWDFGYDGPQVCVSCKGTGKQYVSI